MATRKICQSSYNSLKHSLPAFLMVISYFLLSLQITLTLLPPPLNFIERWRQLEKNCFASTIACLCGYLQAPPSLLLEMRKASCSSLRPNPPLVFWISTPFCSLGPCSCTKPFLIPYGFVPQPDHSLWPEHDGVTCVFEKMFLLDSRSHFSYCLSCLLPFLPITSS